MRPKPPTNYLAGYPLPLVAQIQQLIAQGRLAALLVQKYPQAHAVRTDKALYDYVQVIKNDYLRNAPQLSKVAFDGKLHSRQNILGQHASISRVQGT
ncbi:MAG: pyrophosphatase, partial [Pseudomonadota bacterium]|nr:pyrophosphatase [Pseudomonadota bacterium]